MGKHRCSSTFEEQLPGCKAIPVFVGGRSLRVPRPQATAPDGNWHSFVLFDVHRFICLSMCVRPLNAAEYAGKVNCYNAVHRITLGPVHEMQLTY